MRNLTNSMWFIILIAILMINPAPKAYSVIEFSGNGGQKVLMDKTNDLIVVITAGNYNAKSLKKHSFDILLDIVYPSIRD